MTAPTSSRAVQEASTGPPKALRPLAALLALLAVEALVVLVPRPLPWPPLVGQWQLLCRGGLSGELAAATGTMRTLLGLIGLYLILLASTAALDGIAGASCATKRLRRRLPGPAMISRLLFGLSLGTGTLGCGPSGHASTVFAGHPVAPDSTRTEPDLASKTDAPRLSWLAGPSPPTPSVIGTATRQTSTPTKAPPVPKSAAPAGPKADPRAQMVAGSNSSSAGALLSWTVRPGESFWSIAEAVVGARHPHPDPKTVARYWLVLIRANWDRLAVPGHPDLVFSGQVLTLPPLD